MATIVEIRRGLFLAQKLVNFDHRAQPIVDRLSFELKKARAAERNRPLADRA